MIEVDSREDEPTYEELEHKCTWLRGSLYEARRSRREALEWKGAFLIVAAVSTVLLVLTWSGYLAV